MNLREQYVAFQTILQREILRFMRIWIQTILPAMITSALYFLIFGKVLGKMISDVDGISYIEFIVPGIILMNIIQNSYANAVTSTYSSKFHRNIEEMMVSPTPDYVILSGYVAGGVARGVVVGLSVTIVSMIFTNLTIYSVSVLISITVLTSVLFSIAGFINGIHAKSFDDISIVPTFILTPLTYLGGVFFKLSLLPEFWQKVAMANPILYMVNAFRYGFIQKSDVSILHAYIIIIVFILALYWYALSILRRGVGLRA